MPNPAISIQLWTVRDELAADLDGTLAKLASIGFTHVEAFGFVSRADELSAAFARHGITSPTGHASLASGTENPFDSSIAVPAPAEVFAAAQKLGMTTVFDPFVAADRWESVEEIAKTADALNGAARIGADYGVSVGYHNHNQEFLTKINGRFPLEIFAELLDPAVSLELDLYWASAGGADVATLVERLGDKVTALHIKDGTLEPLPSLGALPTDQVPAGHGVVALTAALDAATHAGFAIIEFDAYSGDIWQGVQTGYEFLAARGLV
ncbi:sugar phosphate isomerase/epimerase [Pseudolysinimonas sp.]|uniref:sugar phosphate isomerase/epimerase family protein n=1 Tax=Pseudolysinimonas sp. TaxID=2680009 RepID=UPI00286BEB76|nr:sugar phosphate isomerase/epimerase [Pseudolysinimonas sp.]